jgi:hypothetical protein
VLTEVQQAEVTDAISRFLVKRAVVEQVKGVLMVTYGITADEAFAKLATDPRIPISSSVDSPPTLRYIRKRNGRGMPSHSSVDELLRTVQQRIRP